VVMEAWVHGVSTRKVDDLVAALGVGSGISKSEVSRICKQLDTDLDAFRSRPLNHVEFPYVFADATYIKGRVNGRVVSRAAVVATGVTISHRIARSTMPAARPSRTAGNTSAKGAVARLSDSPRTAASTSPATSRAPPVRKPQVSTAIAAVERGAKPTAPGNITGASVGTVAGAANPGASATGASGGGAAGGPVGAGGTGRLIVVPAG